MADNESLKKTADAAAELAKQMDVVTVSSSDADKILAKTGKSAEKSAKAFKALSEAGDQTELVFTGISAVMDIVSGALEEISRNSRMADEALAAVLDEKYDVDAVQAVEEAWANATIAQQGFLRGLAEQHEDASDPTKSLAGRALTAARDFETAQQQINEAQKNLGRASIDEMEKRGVISHQQALAAKLRLDEEYERRRLELAKETDAKELDLKQQTADIVKGQISNATKAGADVARKSAIADAKVAHTQVEIQHTQQDKATGQLQMEKSGITSADARNIRNLYEQASGNASVGPNAPSLQAMADYLRILVNNTLNPSNDKKLAGLGFDGVNTLRGLFTSFVTGGRNVSDENISNYEAGEATVNKSDFALGKLDKQLADRKTEADQGKHELERQKRLLDQKSAQLDKLQQEIDELQATNQAKQSNSATVSGINMQIEALKSGQVKPANPFTPPPRATAAGNPGEMDAAIRAAYRAEYSHFEGGKAFDQTQAETIEALKGLLDKAHQNSTAVLNLIVTGIKKHESLDQIIQGVQAQMNHLQASGIH